MMLKHKFLTRVELDYMKVLWRKGQLSVQEMQDALPLKKRTRYTTIMTMLRRMEEKGYVAHEERNRAYYYYPVLSEQDVKRNAIRTVLRNIFDGKPAELVLNLVKDEKLSDEEIKKIKEIIKNSEERK